MSITAAPASHLPHSIRPDVLFVDPDVRDCDVLLDGMGPQVRVVRLQRDGDPLGQIATALAGERDLERLHILSHGEPGALLLAGGRVDAAMLDRSAGRVQAIRHALADDADIVLYGCAVSAGAGGREFVASLEQKLDATVIASAIPVGAGPGWGAFPAALSAFSQESMARYPHTLHQTTFGIVTTIQSTTTLVVESGNETSGLSVSVVRSDGTAMAGVSSGFLDAGVITSATSYTVTYSSAVNITQFQIGEFTNNSTGSNYTFTPNTGSAVTIADNSGSLAGSVATLTPGDWTGITSFTVSFAGGVDWRVGLDNIVYTVAGPTAGNDALTGTAGADTIDLLAGNDSYSGLAGADTITGGAGNDTILAGDDADLVLGGADNDSISGGAGADNLSGDAGDDTFSATSAEITGLAETISGGTGTDVLSLTGGGAFNLSTVTLDSIELISGSASADSITGTSAADTINAGDGANLIVGGGGADSLTGGTGADTFSATSADITGLAETISGGGGTDVLSLTGGGAFNLSTVTLNSIELISGSASIDSITGTSGADTIAGGDGADLINAGDGANLVSGGAGADNLIGGTGADTFSATSAEITGLAETVSGGGGTDVLSLTGGGAFNLSTVTLDSIELISGSASIDSITGTSGADTIAGGDGADLINAGDGANLVSGGAGADNLIGGTGADTFSATSAEITGLAETISGGTGTDVLSLTGGGAFNLSTVTLDSIELISGSASVDSITGTSAADTIAGGDGADLINAGDGANLVSGGAGADNLIGGTGADTFSATSAEITGLAETVSGGTGTDVLSLTGGGAFNLSTVTLDSIELITGSASADSITGTSAADTIHAGDGANVIIGGGGADNLTGGSGADLLSGGAGSDLLFGGTGNDTFTGSVAELNTDTLSGLAAGDVIVVTGTDLSSLNGSTVGSTLDLGGGSTLNLSGTSGSLQYSAVFSGGNTTLTAAAPAAASSGGSSSGGSGDGLTVTSQTSADSAGTATGRTLTNSTGSSATGALVSNTGNGNLVTATLPNGFSVTNSGTLTAEATSTASTTLTGQIQITAPVAGQSFLNGHGQSFITRSGGASLDVRSIGFSGSGTTAQTIQITGASGTSSGSEAFVIDMSGLPTGSTLQLDNIEFAAIVGNATVNGGAGENYVVGDDSTQFISLGAEDDTLAGGGGNDTIGSGFGEDILYGNQGADLVFGGGGMDTVYGGQGDDTVRGDNDDDFVYGNLGNDTLSGGENEDVLFGGQNEDIVYGNSGNDTLYGNLGNDTLYGGQGIDLISGADGTDVLIGGQGADSFEIGFGDDIDQVLDFSLTEGDRIRVDVDGTGIGSISSLVQNLTTDSSGNLLVSIGNGDGLTLVGLTAADASSVNVDLVSGGSVISSGTLDGAVTGAFQSLSQDDDRPGQGDWLFDAA